MAKAGDVIVRFWGCGTAAVMRPTEDSDLYMLIGNADISKTTVSRKSQPYCMGHKVARSTFLRETTIVPALSSMLTSTFEACRLKLSIRIGEGL